MPGSAIISPASFGDTSLPRLDLRPVAPIAGAVHDWASERLAPGPIEAWYDMVQNVPFVAPAAPSQKPVVYEGGRKVVRFNGVDQRLDVDINMPGPVTMVLVARVNTDANSQYIVTGGAGPGFNVYRGGTGRWTAYASASLAHSETADTGTHVFVVVRDGVNSVLSVDGVESRGDMGSVAATSLRLGSSSNAYFATDVQRLALLPFAASQTQRTAIVAQMRAAYNI